MTRVYYIVGALFIGLGSYYLYNKIKSGNIEFNDLNEIVPDDGVGVNLEPPMEVTDLATPPIV